MNALIRLVRSCPAQRPLDAHVRLRQFARAHQKALHADLMYAARAAPLAQDTYTRTVLDRTPHTELALLVWNSGATSGWHSHPRRIGSFAVVSGSLTELLETGGPRSIYKTQYSTPLDFAYISDAMGRHCMLNVTPVPAYSLHLYTRVDAL